MLQNMAKVTITETQKSLTQPINGGSVCFINEELVDKEALLASLLKSQETLKKEIARAQGMLSNERFTSKAPAEKVKEEQDKLDEYIRQLNLVEEQLNQ